MKIHHVMYIILAVFMLTGLAHAGGVVVVTNKTVTGSVTSDKVKEIFTGRLTKWPDNQTIVPVILEGSEAHREFLKAYVGKSESQFSATWKKMMFTGQASYPKSFDSAQALVDFVAKTPGAIGYVDAGAKTEGVSVHKQ